MRCRNLRGKKSNVSMGQRDKSVFKGDINMIKLQEVKEEEQELLWNINQKYQYEITTYYSDKIDEQGN